MSDPTGEDLRVIGNIVMDELSARGVKPEHALPGLIALVGFLAREVGPDQRESVVDLIRLAMTQPPSVFRAAWDDNTGKFNVH